MSNRPKVALVPKLRFAEFRYSGEWRATPLNQLATRGKQKNRDEKIERVLTNSAEFGVMDQRDYFDKDIATQGKLEGYIVVELGDYVYNPRISATAPVGPISKNNIATGVMSPLYTVFKFKNDDNDFYSHYFKTAGWHKYMRQASSTGARHDRMAISSADFMAMPLPTASPEEQQKIADCLSSSDELIAAQARKVEALKIYKKGLMQQLFPRKGETQPRLRFPEFQNAGDWEEKALASIAELTSSKRVHLSDYVPTGIPFFRGKEISLLKNNQIPLDVLFISEEHYEGIKKNYGVPKIGDILITAVGTLGNVYCIRNLNKFYFKDGNLIWMKNISEDSLFLEILLNVNSKRVLSSAIGSSQKALTMVELNKLTFAFPKKEEQQRISDCLNSLDNLITTATQELETLKTHKKGLMQQLFPSAEAVEA